MNIKNLIIKLDNFADCLSAWESTTVVPLDERKEIIDYMTKVVDAIGIDGTLEFAFELEDCTWSCYLKSFFV